jgi:hypothetical protein
VPTAKTRSDVRQELPLNIAYTHVLEDMTKVLTISIHEDAAVSTHVLCISAAEVGVEKGMWDTSTLRFGSDIRRC